MPCKRSTLKKYKTRPSPPYPAQDCRGKRKKGSDGSWYISSADKGIYRWKKEPNMGATTAKKAKKVKGVKGTNGAKKMVCTHSYMIHDNGGRPYKVDVSPSEVTVSYQDTPVYQVRMERIWLGDNLLSLPQYAPRNTGKGNTVLVQTAPHQYTHIGHTIYSFDTGGDEILEYYSPIGNSDVPYPYAVGRENVYFLLDKKKVSVDKLDITKDGYTQFYDEVSAGDKKGFRVQTIHSQV